MRTPALVPLELTEVEAAGVEGLFAWASHCVGEMEAAAYHSVGQEK
jgi:hypothetical protein